MNDQFTGWRKASYSGANGGCVEVGAGWRKSSYSGSTQDCVEVGTPGWRKASYSDVNGGCVEVSASERVIGVRDTKQHGEGPVLEFPVAAWHALVAEVKSGRLDC
jgi:hypothetical protein